MKANKNQVKQNKKKAYSRAMRTMAKYTIHYQTLFLPLRIENISMFS